MKGGCESAVRVRLIHCFNQHKHRTKRASCWARTSVRRHSGAAEGGLLRQQRQWPAEHRGRAGQQRLGRQQLRLDNEAEQCRGVLLPLLPPQGRCVRRQQQGRVLHRLPGLLRRRHQQGRHDSRHRHARGWHNSRHRRARGRHNKPARRRGRRRRRRPGAGRPPARPQGRSAAPGRQAGRLAGPHLAAAAPAGCPGHPAQAPAHRHCRCRPAASRLHRRPAQRTGLPSRPRLWERNPGWPASCPPGRQAQGRRAAPVQLAAAGARQPAAAPAPLPAAAAPAAAQPLRCRWRQGQRPPPLPALRAVRQAPPCGAAGCAPPAASCSSSSARQNRSAGAPRCRAGGKGMGELKQSLQGLVRGRKLAARTSSAVRCIASVPAAARSALFPFGCPASSQRLLPPSRCLTRSAGRSARARPGARTRPPPCAARRCGCAGGSAAGQRGRRRSRLPGTRPS